ncbi:MAG: hypothetical protein VB996_04335 [Pseudomonadales bacterium]
MARIGHRRDGGGGGFFGFRPEHADKHSDCQEDEKAQVMFDHEELSVSSVLSVSGWRYGLAL